ncbi:MAG TPA: transcriptional regulator [Beijerinckiaceae bacterium]|nr:transcriptional regulator [Beijerinckiaceae bacterium]
MQTHPKKRIEIVLEAPALNRLIDRLEKANVSGYTVLPALAGRGSGGGWSREGLAGDAGRMVMVLCIIDGARVDEVLEAAYGVVSRHIGIVAVSDVQVIRAEHFR